MALSKENENLRDRLLDMEAEKLFGNSIGTDMPPRCVLFIPEGAWKA